MKIRNHRLVDDSRSIDFVASPNVGGMIEPRSLVIYYPAGNNAVKSIEWLKNPSSKVSAHLVIARDGAITQMVPFNRLAQHADTSQWASLDGFTRPSIDNEIDYARQLVLSGGQWVSPVGRCSYAADEVALAIHHLSPSPPSDGFAHTQAQLAVTLEVCQTLVNHYELIKGHDSDSIASMGPRMPEPDFSRASPSGIEVDGLSRKGIWQGDESAGWCPGRFLDTASVLAPSLPSRFDRN